MRLRTSEILSRRPAVILVIACCALFLGGCKTAWRTLVYNVPGITDYEIFSNRTINSGEHVRTLVDDYVAPLPALDQWAFGKKFEPGMSSQEFFDKTGTVAFLMLKRDTILHEYYAPNRHRESVFTTFSLAKVYVSTLVGIAIDEGLIESVDEPVSDFLPQFKDSSLAGIKIRHLLQMTAGLQSGESFFNPFNRVVRMYYGEDLGKATRKLKAKYPPGKKFRYLNLNTQILSMVLQKATGKPLAKYLEEKIWRPAGMEADASWSLDKVNGTEKAFCCLNAHARDFARFGLLFLDEGVCERDSLVSSNWVCSATSLDTSAGSPPRYQYHWYLSAEQTDYFGQGLIGQFLYVCPATEVVIVRLGRKIEFSPWYQMFRNLSGIDYKPTKVEIAKTDLRKFEGEYEFGLSNFGDTTLLGKRAKVSARNGFLRVNPTFRSAFKMQPESDSLFFNLKDARKILFHTDGAGDVTHLEWSRRGNRWKVKKIGG